MNVAVYTYSARAVPEAHDHQRVACERLAHELGYEPVRSYQDNSGARDALERLLADVREGSVSALLIVSLDRLGRRVQAVTSVLDTLRDAGVEVARQCSSLAPSLQRVAREQWAIRRRPRSAMDSKVSTARQPQPVPRLTEVMLDDAHRRYEAGTTLRLIAGDLGADTARIRGAAPGVVT